MRIQLKFIDMNKFIEKKKLTKSHLPKNEKITKVTTRRNRKLDMSYHS